MRTIYKYEVPVSDEWTKIELPLDAMILHVDRAPYPDAVWFWAEVETNEPMVSGEFRVFGTGHELLPDAGYWGTVHYLEYGLVWHLYERRPDGLPGAG